MRRTTSTRGHRRIQKRILLFDENHPIAELRLERLRGIGYDVDYAGSETDLDRLLGYHRYDLVLVAFDDCAHPGKAKTICRKLELTRADSVVGWLASGTGLLPPQPCPTIVWEHESSSSSYADRISALIQSGQKCRAVCVLWNPAEISWKP